MNFGKSWLKSQKNNEKFPLLKILKLNNFLETFDIKDLKTKRLLFLRRFSS